MSTTPSHPLRPLPESVLTERAVPAKSVQAYIDETPVWADGTRTPGTPLTRMQWRIWWLATAGKFFEGLVIFMSGVALPLLVMEFHLSDLAKGLVSAAPLAGILIGATALGGLADRFGRKRLFIAEMVLFVVCLGSLVVSQGLIWLLVSLLGMGAALGCDYPTAHLMLSETIPSRTRGRLVLAAFGFQALGALVGTGVGYLVLGADGTVSAWRLMYATVLVPALAVAVGRFGIPDSAHWLAACGRVREAERATMRLLRRRPAYPHHVVLARPAESRAPSTPRSGYAALFSARNRRATILAGVPWFLQDLATYGIGIFTPTILATVVGATPGTARNLADLIHNDLLASRGAALLDLLLLVGIGCAILLADKVGRLRLQIVGFCGCAAGLALAAVSLSLAGSARTVLLFAGFMLFNFMTNLGPNAMSYLLAGEVFPLRIRAKGAGLAASTAKIGAVLTALLFPVLLHDLGARIILAALTAAALAGASVTWRFGIETAGVNLERIGKDENAA